MQKNTKATLQDVAKQCGLSVSTVSKILSNKEGFKDDTRKMVQEVVEKLNYHPNIMARSVVKKEASPIIGVFIPNVHNPFFAELVNQIEKYLTQNEYILMLCLYDDNTEKLNEYLQTMESLQASGVIVACFREDEKQKPLHFNRNYMPLISIQSDIEGVDRVDTTDQQGTYEMIEYLIKCGHKKIGFIGYQYDMSILDARLQGYLQALNENNIPICNDYIKEGKHSKNSGYAMTQTLLHLQDPPTAIHCFNELMVEGAIQAIHTEKLNIPNDISLTGFDNTIISTLTTPQITTIDNPVNQLAKQSVEILMKRIESKEKNSQPKHILIPHRFIERDSVKTIV